MHETKNLVTSERLSIDIRIWAVKGWQYGYEFWDEVLTLLMQCYPTAKRPLNYGSDHDNGERLLFPDILSVLSTHIQGMHVQ